VKSVAEIDGAAAALLEPELPELGAAEPPPPLLPQAARMSAALPATAVRPTLLETEYNENHLARGRDKPRAWLLFALPLPAVPRGAGACWDDHRTGCVNGLINICAGLLIIH